MSINVTINGKPINLTKTRGRMVACVQDSEFNKRRKIRLQQVRQQSKEIAADVRNRVKQERTKQLSNIEHQTEKDLKKFQDRKLHTLRKQYEDCNREIGAAHKNAALEKDPSEVLNELSKKNDKSAHERLKVAVENKAKEELQRKNKLELLEKQRKYSKDVEKTRANLVVGINKHHSPSKLNKSNKKRKKKTEANLSDTFNSDIENISSPPRRSRSPIKLKKTSPNKWKKTPERKSQQKPQNPQKQINSQKQSNPKNSENSKSKKIIFDHEIHQVCDENFIPEPKEPHSKINTKSTLSEKHLNDDIKSPRKVNSEVDIELPQKESPCPVCFDVKSTQTEKHIKIDVGASRKEKSKLSCEHPQKEIKCFVCWEQSKSRQFHEGKSETSYPKRVISSAKGNLIYDDETSPCLSPLPHDRAILHPTSPPTPTKCASHFSSSSSLTKEISKDEIKKLIEEHRPANSRSTNFYKTTKISDRIRQRSEQLSQDIDLDSINIPELKRKSTNLRDAKKLEMKNIPIVDIPSVQETLKEGSKLPYVPKTTLKSRVTLTNVPQQQTTKAKYYDHSKHFTKTYIPPASVQKLDKDCVEVNTSIESAENADFYKKMYSQEERAKIRGDKALKRAQIQNDYKQLMEELPVLQKQERLAAMRNHNPEFHMTDERLHELERRRQSRIENIFEKYYHKSKTLETPVITIRPVQKPAPDEEMKLPFTALDVSEELQPFNVGQWKSENPSHASKSLRQFESTTRKTGSSSGNKFQFVDSKPEISSETPSQKVKLDDDCRQKCLAELLHRLNKQRELLLQEVQNLPPTSNLQKILHDDTLLHITDDSSNSIKPKFVSASTSPILSESKKTKNKKRQSATTSSDSPEEKQKKRQKPKEKKSLKVVKNDEGTQTSPNIVTKSPPVKEKPPIIKDVPLEGKHPLDDDKLCEIIIKMCDESKVKICTQPIGSVERKHEEIVRPPQKQINCDISSSTSYLSPPILIPKSDEQTEKSRSDYKDILYSKPKQTNIDSFPKREHVKDERYDHIKKHSISKQKKIKPHTPTKIINPQLLNYIKKLLSMSRKSIDDLTVSSISDVSSPSPRIVESQHNNPFIQLQNVMNYYNLSFADIQNQLSKSSSSETKSDKKSNTNAEMEQLDGGDSSPTSDDVDYSEILSKYQEVTKSCVDKISTLTLMIDKIRAEKENILSPISVDLNENTLTSYLELPPQKEQEINSLSSKNCTSTSGGSNKSCSLTQEEIDRYFLEISPRKKQTDGKNQGDMKETFVPMLKGIPKYNNEPIVNEVNFISKPRPPASLSQNVQRYNLNIDMTPHELSTIVELDTATTSKNISTEQRPKSPEEHVPIRDSDDIPSPPSHSQSQSHSQSHQSKEETTYTSNSGFITISPEHQDTPSNSNQNPNQKKARKSPRSKNTNLKASCLQISSPSENTSSSSPENIENILRTMGLGWAVSTLKKTQEALALSSSSSSDSSVRKHDLQDMSDIGGVTQIKDRSTQRTSTPVHQSKSTDSKNNLFASVSDISSVRLHSDENMFLSIPDISLDTNRSLK